MGSIRKENIKYSEEPFKKIIKAVLEKYNLDLVENDCVDISRNILVLNIFINKPITNLSISSMLSVIKIEITEKIFYFSGIKPNSIQLIIGVDN